MQQILIDEPSIRDTAKTDGVTHFATGIAVFRDDKLLVVKRVAEDDFLGGEWELPGGGVDAGETFIQGATRELLEETGLRVNEILATFESFDYSTPTKPLVRQVNFNVSVLPGEIKLEPTEHDEYRWVGIDDVPSLKTNPVMQKCLTDSFNWLAH